MSIATPSPGAAGLRRWQAPVLLALLLVWFALLFDWNWFKHPLERAIERRSGRSFVISGNIDVDLIPRPTLRLDRAHLGNAAWSRDPVMARAQRLELGFEPWALLKGDIVLERVAADRLELLLEREGSGRNNWTFERLSSTPRVDQLNLANGHLRVRDSSEHTDLAIDVDSGHAGGTEARAPLLLRGSGRFRGEPFELHGQVASPLELVHADRPYRIDLDMSAGKTHARLSGDLVEPLQLTGFDLALELSGDNMARMYKLTGLALPDTPPYRLKGQLSRYGDTWNFRAFDGRVGDSDLSGESRIEVGRARPMLHADLKSKRLDLDDLAGFVGATPGTGPGETASAGQQREAEQKKSSPRVLPDTPYDLVKLQAMDADVKLDAHQVVAKPLPMSDMHARLTIDAGLARLDPLTFGVAGGKLSGQVTLDARQAPIASSAKLKLNGLDLKQLAPNIELAQTSIGRFGGSIDLAGRGNSVALMLAGSNGSAQLNLGPGQISNLLMELAGLDLAEALKFKLIGDRQIPIRCGFAHFQVKDGVMSTNDFAFDTTDTLILGQGDANLRDETLAFKLEAKPKDKSPLALRAPLALRGTFKQVTLKPEGKAVALRAAVTAALFTLAPPAALAGVVEVGPGKDVDCSAKTIPAKLAMKQEPQTRKE